MAQAIDPADTGRPSTEAVAESGMIIVDCGRSVGYTDRRLEYLREVAEFGVDRGRDVQWG